LPYEQGEKKDRRVLLRAGGIAVAVFVLSLVGLLLATFAFARRLGLDLSFS